MKRSVLVVLFLIAIPNILYCQNRNTLATKNFVWFTPSNDNNINGLALGAFVDYDKSWKSASKSQVINGFNLEILGLGFINTMYVKSLFFDNTFDVFKSEDCHLADLTNKYNHNINGASVSLFGSFNPYLKVNGLNVSPFSSYYGKINGLSINLMFNGTRIVNGVCISILNKTNEIRGVQCGVVNKSFKTKGVQIGLINKTKILKGFQFGLWNKNEKRSLPIINWDF